MRPIVGITILATAIAGCMPAIAFAQADLYSRDTPADTGAEPNPDTGPMWVSEDIWVRNSPDPNYRPVPFTAASPPWTPAAHQSPEYRDPRFGVPNYVYIRVRNRGTATSSGTDQLRLYWAKASTGLAWPASWVDALSTVCGNERLLGAEITKPRVNAATASAADRTLLRDAYLEIATTSAFDLLAGYDYWTKQQQVHRYFPEHDNPAFLPWHREFLNRLEALLQEAKPLTKLMYWNWTTDPAASGAANLVHRELHGHVGPRHHRRDQHGRGVVAVARSDRGGQRQPRGAEPRAPGRDPRNPTRPSSAGRITSAPTRRTTSACAWRKRRTTSRRTRMSPARWAPH